MQYWTHKVGDLGAPVGSDQDVRTLEISMNDRGCAQMSDKRSDPARKQKRPLKQER
jgi:hypothetical protein